MRADGSLLLAIAVFLQAASAHTSWRYAVFKGFDFDTGCKDGSVTASRALDKWSGSGDRSCTPVRHDDAGTWQGYIESNAAKSCKICNYQDEGCQSTPRCYDVREQASCTLELWKIKAFEVKGCNFQDSSAFKKVAAVAGMFG